jgi:hypothetical protein
VHSRAADRKHGLAGGLHLILFQTVTVGRRYACFSSTIRPTNAPPTAEISLTYSSLHLAEDREQALHSLTLHLVLDYYGNSTQTHMAPFCHLAVHEAVSFYYTHTVQTHV